MRAHALFERVGFEKVSFANMPAVMVRVVRENKRKGRHVTGERIDFVASKMMNEKIMPLLIGPIDREEIAEVAESRNQENADAGKGLIDF